MEHYLDYLWRFVLELRATNSRILKEEILGKWWKREQEWLKHYPDANSLEKLLHYVYDYTKQYYVTSANILKKDLTKTPSIPVKHYGQVWELLDDLSNRVITGHSAILAVQTFLNEQYDDSKKELVLCIINKDLKCGLSEVTINEVIPNLIKTYDVCLAQKFDPKKHILDASWYIERKLDGVRCNVINRNGVIRCYSRQGKEILTLGMLVQELSGKMPNNTVFDGEICLIDESGHESFQNLMKEIKRKDHTIKNPLFMCFDMLTLDEFENKHGSTAYTTRMELLKTWYSSTNWGTQKKVANHMSVVNYAMYSPETFEIWKKRVQEYSWEGLMFRRNVGYEGKRTNNLLKFKSWQDAEYVVVGVEEGDAQELIDGVMQKIKCVGNLVIEHKGNKVGVGTGLSLEQRKRWHVHPEEIIGKTVTIKYFEELKDKDGKYSLRFPVLKTVYEQERDL